MMVPAQVADGIRNLTVWVIPLILAITMREAAHGYVAWRMGDDTAKRMGRLSWNPANHIDPFGTILLPGMLLLMGGMMLGWPKPVPINYGRLKPPRSGMALVAAAGLGVNLLLAVISALLMHTVNFLPQAGRVFVFANLTNSIEINLILLVFNLLPLPPLDLGRVLVALLPSPYDYKLAQMERYTVIVLLVGLFLLPMVGFNPFVWVVGLPASLMKAWLLQAVGIM
jgi:Zn-dependent protease